MKSPASALPSCRYMKREGGRESVNPFDRLGDYSLVSTPFIPELSCTQLCSLLPDVLQMRSCVNSAWQGRTKVRKAGLQGSARKKGSEEQTGNEAVAEPNNISRRKGGGPENDGNNYTGNRKTGSRKKGNLTRGAGAVEFLPLKDKLISSSSSPLLLSSQRSARV